MFLSMVSVSDYFNASLCCNTSEPHHACISSRNSASYYNGFLSDSLFESSACGQEANK